jgi:hypothetical protein
MTEKYRYPKEENLGFDCTFWDMGCQFPKAEMLGRTSCEGIIDPVCIYLKDGKRVESMDLTEDQIFKLKTTTQGILNQFQQADP